MNGAAEVSADGGRITVLVPLAVRKWGSRKLVIAPAAESPLEWPEALRSSSLINAVVRAHRWQQLLDAGTYCSMRELAAAERISPTYVSRLLQLTLLAPKVVEALLDGRLEGARSEQWLLDLATGSWEEQQRQARL